jgi:hypothetical protein
MQTAGRCDGRGRARLSTHLWERPKAWHGRTANGIHLGVPFRCTARATCERTLEAKEVRVVFPGAGMDLARTGRRPSRPPIVGEAHTSGDRRLPDRPPRPVGAVGDDHRPKDQRRRGLTVRASRVAGRTRPSTSSPHAIHVGPFRLVPALTRAVARASWPAGPSASPRPPRRSSACPSQHTTPSQHGSEADVQAQLMKRFAHCAPTTPPCAPCFRRTQHTTRGCGGAHGHLCAVRYALAWMCLVAGGQAEAPGHVA